MDPKNKGDGIPDSRAVSGAGEPDVRLELAGDGTRRIWALYSEERLQRSEPLPGLLELARRGCSTMALWTVVMLVLGVVYLRFAEPIYAVTARLVVAQRTLLGDTETRPVNSTQFVTTQAEIVASPAVVREALATLPDSALPQPEGGPIKAVLGGVRSVLTALSILRPAAPPDPVHRVLEKLTVTPITGSNVLNISFMGPNPDGGTQIVQQVIDSYQRAIRGMEATDHAQDTSLLEQRELELRAQIEELEERYAKERAGTQVIGEDLNAVSVQKELLARLAAELVTARANTVNLENRARELRQHASAGETSQSRERLREELWRVEAELEDLRERRAERHPDVLLLQKRVDSLRRQLGRMNNLEMADLKREVAAAKSTEARLNELYAQEVKKAEEIDANWVKQRRLRDEIERVAAVHTQTLTQLRAAQLTGRGLEVGRAQVTVHVLEPPLRPLEALWPRPLLVLLPAALLGAVIGLGLTALAARNEAYAAAAVPLPGAVAQTGLRGREPVDQIAPTPTRTLERLREQG